MSAPRPSPEPEGGPRPRRKRGGPTRSVVALLGRLLEGDGGAIDRWNRILAAGVPATTETSLSAFVRGYVVSDGERVSLTHSGLNAWKEYGQ